MAARPVSRWGAAAPGRHMSRGTFPAGRALYARPPCPAQWCRASAQELRGRRWLPAVQETGVAAFAGTLAAHQELCTASQARRQVAAMLGLGPSCPEGPGQGERDPCPRLHTLICRAAGSVPVPHPESAWDGPRSTNLVTLFQCRQHRTVAWVFTWMVKSMYLSIHTVPEDGLVLGVCLCKMPAGREVQLLPLGRVNGQ